MRILPKFIQRKMEKKGKSFEEQQRLDRYYRREDAVSKAIRQQKEAKRRQQRLETVRYKADMEEQIARRRAYRLSGQRPVRISRRTPRLK